MKKIFLIFTFLVIEVFSCTTIIVTKEASEDGSIMVAMAADDEVGDQRIVYVPAKDHEKGSKRPIYPYFNNYPRYVGKGLGPAYDIKGLEPTKPLGYIDEVEHTYAYFDGCYGLINEHQLSIGESTCASYYNTDPGKDRIFDTRALSHIALERCTKAKEAILLMGKLAENYGYYGYGETLTIADKDEGWTFEISGTGMGKSAVWVAKKIPEGEVFVCPNIFRIREIDPKDSNILYSSNLFTLAKQNNWWDPKENKKLDWLKVISPGEYDHPYYSLRRIWRIYSRLNPSMNLSPWVKDAFTNEYPFSIKPLKKLSVRDVFSLLRDHYEQTPFDLTKGLAAGPFGNPYRFFGPYDHLYNESGFQEPAKLPGAWERSPSVIYTGYAYVNQIRKNLPDEIAGICWIALDNPYTSCMIPLYIGVNNLPDTIQYQNIEKFDESQLWWIFNLTANYAMLKFDYMKKDILDIQTQLEKNLFDNQKNIEQKALLLYKKNPQEAKKFLTEYTVNTAYYIKDKWWDFSKKLIAKYNDGYVNKPVQATEVGYPKGWLDKVGYQNGPTTYEKPKNNDNNN